MNFKNFYYLKLIFLIVFLFLLLHMIFYAVIVIMKLLMGIKKEFLLIEKRIQKNFMI